MKNSFKQTQRGFTLLELVVVIAVVGVLLVVAMPKLLSTSNDARQAAVNKVAEALTAGATQNYVIRAADNTKGVAVLLCNVVGSTLQSLSVPSGYTITDTSAVSVSLQTTGSLSSSTCTVSSTATPAVTATFTAYGIN